ncbi:MAG TPA: NAD(P)H-hydrate epimerase, partial [Candidatus Bathyarchaeia archaeon]|nr:NAD(P)H-hydrate epimerase [Candidatus Bathyarchaeia archaeon]
MEITVKQMMQIEENGHQMGFPRKLMMENAGAVTARYLLKKYEDISKKKISVFAGLGNNGGDAM